MIRNFPKKVIFLDIIKYTHAKKRINVVTGIRDIHEKNDLSKHSQVHTGEKSKKNTNVVTVMRHFHKLKLL